MQGRIRRLVIAAAITAGELAIVARNSLPIRQAWDADPWNEAVLFGFLVLSISSAAPIWLQVLCDLRQTIREEAPSRLLNPVPTAGDIPEEGE